MHSLWINGPTRDDLATHAAGTRVPRLPRLATVSGHGTLLPLPDDPRLAWLVTEWPWFAGTFTYPRSVWLGQYERVLREWFPAASSRDRSLTARHYAPFPLAAGHDVP